MTQAIALGSDDAPSEIARTRIDTNRDHPRPHFGTPRHEMASFRCALPSTYLYRWDFELVPGRGEVGGVDGLIPHVNARIAVDGAARVNHDCRQIELRRARIQARGGVVVRRDIELLGIGAG